MADRRERLRSMRLYALLTERQCRQPWRDTAEMLIRGGVDAIQLREKRMPDGELLDRARVLREMTAGADVLFIVNDRPDIALLSQADGVHVGQGDLPPAEVRSLLGRELLVGFSTHSVEQARAACESPVDYVAIGPVAPTQTKGYDQGIGMDMVGEVCALCAAKGLPVVAIGGIAYDTVMPVMRAGAAAIAACSALCGDRDPLSAAQELRALVEKAVAERGEARE